MVPTTLALILFLAPLAYSPGPGNMVFAAMGARFGLRATLPANFSYHVATWLVTFGLGLGFSALIAKAPTLFEVIRWAGAIYVAFLFWTIVGDGLLARFRHRDHARLLNGAFAAILGLVAVWLFVAGRTAV